MAVTDGRRLTHALGGAAAGGQPHSVAGGPIHPKLFLQLGRKGGRLTIGSADLAAPVLPETSN